MAKKTQIPRRNPFPSLLFLLLAPLIFSSKVASASAIIASSSRSVDLGYDVYKPAQVMINLSAHSWEWGTAAEALLELYNPELTVFGADPFPNGRIPAVTVSASAGDSSGVSEVTALAYAKQYIETGRQTLVPDSAVGDPASLGVFAILLGQSDRMYLDAAERQADYILNHAPRYSNGAISHRSDVAELWADFIAMAPPFLAYQAVQQNNITLMAEAVTQCSLYRDVLQASGTLSWQHIIGPQSQDTGLWSTSNGWAAYGMIRVLYTLQKWPGSSSSMTHQAGQLKAWIREILDGAMNAGLDNDNSLLRNYLDDESWWGEISGTALLSAAAYRMAVNDPGAFGQRYISWADSNRETLSGLQSSSTGVFSPAVDPYAPLDRTPCNTGSPEGQAFMVYLYTAYRDYIGAGVCQTGSTTTTISEPGIEPTTNTYGHPREL